LVTSNNRTDTSEQNIQEKRTNFDDQDDLLQPESSGYTDGMAEACSLHLVNHYIFAGMPDHWLHGMGSGYFCDS